MEINLSLPLHCLNVSETTTFKEFSTFLSSLNDTKKQHVAAWLALLFPEFLVTAPATTPPPTPTPSQMPAVKLELLELPATYQNRTGTLSLVFSPDVKTEG